MKTNDRNILELARYLPLDIAEEVIGKVSEKYGQDYKLDVIWLELFGRLYNDIERLYLETNELKKRLDSKAEA